MSDHGSKYHLSDEGIHTLGNIVPLDLIGKDVDGPLVLQMLKTAYSHGAYDEAKASLERMSRAAFPSAYTEPEHAKALDKLAADKLAADMRRPVEFVGNHENLEAKP